MEAADVFTKLDVQLRPDPSRTVIRPFSFGYPPAFSEDRPPRAQVVADRVRALDDDMRKRMRDLLLTPMRERHRNVEQVLIRRFEEVRDQIGPGDSIKTTSCWSAPTSARNMRSSQRRCSTRASWRFLRKSRTTTRASASSCRFAA